ncbi:hypothetical protein B0T17DRAFT_536585 [Bombardia bombarda]|uniref:Uncharacterized protein n=1 Tax=Bombardia bombarda TaxID=252184 RepID=A0AA39WM91_9PEZI|nr:hypothetical protein B0T17DRAFT_536585 [Bombardia bombarda]
MCGMGIHTSIAAVAALMHGLAAVFARPSLGFSGPHDGRGNEQENELGGHGVGSMPVDPGSPSAFLTSILWEGYTTAVNVTMAVVCLAT